MLSDIKNATENGRLKLKSKEILMQLYSNSNIAAAAVAAAAAAAT